MAPVSSEQVKAAAALWATAPAESVAELTRLLKFAADDTGSALSVLEELIPLKERHERIRHGQLPYHALSLDELHFHHAQPELAHYLSLTGKAVQNVTTVQVVLHRCMALAAAQKFEALDQVLPHVKPLLGRHVWSNVNFDWGFYESLEAMSGQGIGADLPAVEYSVVPDGRGTVIFLACDLNYYGKFALPLLRSLAAHQQGAAVHLHLFDVTTQQREDVHVALNGLDLAVSTSSEIIAALNRTDAAAARSYFHSIRFVRLYQHMLRFPRETWLLDVDALINRSPAEFFKLAQGSDLALRIRPGRFEPWNQFSAAMLGVTPTHGGMLYLKLVAGYIASFEKQGALGWGIDQLAMYAVFQYLRRTGRALAISLLDAKSFDVEHAENSIVWLTAGAAKLKIPNSAEANAGESLSRYDALLRRYTT